MFRPMRKVRKAISDEAAKELLFSAKRGIFAVNGDDGYPYAIPVNFYYDRDAEKIYFHGSKAGHKIDSIKKSDKVCFTVYGNEHFTDGDWAPYSQSAVVFGRCRLIDDPAITEEKVRQMALKYYPTAEEVEVEIAQGIKYAQLYEISIEHLTGKEVQEK